MARHGLAKLIDVKYWPARVIPHKIGCDDFPEDIVRKECYAPPFGRGIV
jgi:hypothetical protein